MNKTTPAPQDYLPLSSAVFAILIALADGEKHGYAIMQEARQHTAMGPGTLYGSLDRLLGSGLVEETGVTDDPRRRYYRLAALGRKVLTAETARLEASVSRARKKGIPAVEVRI
jgi:DNA-binding PadR family transcriptional regulator